MKKYLIIIGVIIVIIAVYLFIRLTPVISVFPAHPLDRLNSSQPKDIVLAVQEFIYSTSTPIDEYANIRWGEKGTFRNKDVPAFWASTQSTDGDLIYSQYNKTKEILEKNSFIKDEANTFGEFEKPNISNSNSSREDTGYQNKDTICTVSISTQPTQTNQKYYLSFKCGTFDGSFEVTQR
jgi:hypothetical protein